MGTRLWQEAHLARASAKRFISVSPWKSSSVGSPPDASAALAFCRCSRKRRPALTAFLVPSSFKAGHARNVAGASGGSMLVAVCTKTRRCGGGACSDGTRTRRQIICPKVCCKSASPWRSRRRRRTSARPSFWREGNQRAFSKDVCCLVVCVSHVY